MLTDLLSSGQETREGWREVVLGDVVFIQQGKRVDHFPVGEAPVQVLGATGVVGSWSESTYQDPRVALGCRGTVGSVRLISEAAWFGNNVMAIWPRDYSELSLEFLALALEGVDLEGQGAIGGQVQKQITRSSLSSVHVQLPSVFKQKHIVDLIGTVDDMISAAEQGAKSLRELRSNLLTALLSGEHEIPESYDDLLEATA